MSSTHFSKALSRASQPVVAKGSIPAAAWRALTFAHQQLRDTRRENLELKATNEKLRSALEDAASRGSEARRIAQHDALTGLPNRLALSERLNQAITAANLQQCKLALLFLDLDGFKTVNDCFGHTTGDKLLSAAATRIASCIRSGDIAYRYGGDEFVVVLANVNDADTAGSIAGKIRMHVGERFAIDGRQIQITASIGLALYPDDGEIPEGLLSCADASMYRDKFSHTINSAAL